MFFKGKSKPIAESKFDIGDQVWFFTKHPYEEGIRSAKIKALNKYEKGKFYFWIDSVVKLNSLSGPIMSTVTLPETEIFSTKEEVINYLTK